MKKTAVKVTFTNGIVLEGVSDFIGGATMCVNVPIVTTEALNELYKLDASIRGNDDHWAIQVAKKHISEVQFIAVN